MKQLLQPTARAIGLAGLLFTIAAATAAPLRSPDELAAAHLRDNHAALGLTARDVADARISAQSHSRHNGISHIQFQQQLGGIDVYGGVLLVNVARDGRILSVDNDFAPDLARRARARVPKLTAQQAVTRAAEALGLAAPRALQVREQTADASRRTVFAPSGVSKRDIPARLVYVARRTGPVRLAWDLPIETDQEHYWQIQVDAVGGHVLQQRNFVLNHTYNVYPLPYESPTHTPGGGVAADSRTAAVNPENASASPGGWVAGLTTDGPNVQAQTDLDANDAYTPGTDRKPAGAGLPNALTFDYPANPTLPASAYLDALVVNLFYWNNILHDVFELYGFDETSFNFEGNDPVLADAQDGLGTNNANFLTLPDGTPGRMQMYLWTPPAAVQINSPYAAEYTAGSAGFGAQLNEVGVTGDLQLVDDGTEPTNDACEAMTPGSLAGKIALLDRGTCEFGTKMKNAQNAGAIAGILVNIQSDDPIGMGPGVDGATVTMPSVSIGKGSGNEIKASIAGGNTVNATLRSGTIPFRDSDFDNGVIAHEYGHGVSNRLAGMGFQAPLCLQGDQQAGEGWSDWWALALTQLTATENPGGRGIGSYVSYQPTTGSGIRPFRYSTDMSINPQTYGDLAEGTLSIPHGIGTVWATTLWDMYWALVRGQNETDPATPALGWEPNIYNFASGKGNTVAMQLVMDGLKLGGCNPSMLESRDAILLADEENNAGANQCAIWWAFARRGMGVNAQSESGDIAVTPGNAVTEDFTLPLECSNVCPPPLFGGASRVVAPPGGGCTLTVEWPAATDNCATSGIRYDLYRATDLPFTPSAGNLLAGNLDSLSYTDETVVGGNEYHYVVRARDGNGNVEANFVRRSNIAAGRYIADPDGIKDDAGDTTQVFARASSTGWAVRAAGGVDGTKVHATSGAGNYADDTCTFLESDILKLGAAPTLTFESLWTTEPTFDGGIVEIATEAGGFTNWTKLDDIAYPGVMLGEPGFTTSCSNPGLADGQPAFTGVSPTGEFQAFESDLADFANQSVKIRFVFGSDGSTNDLGWFVDDIVVAPLQTPEAGCPVNLPPVVDAGTDFEVDENEGASLSGTATDDTVGSLSYRWTQIAGPTVLLDDPDSAMTSFTAPFVAMDTTLEFELEVTDAEGLSAVDSIIVTVLDVDAVAPPPPQPEPAQFTGDTRVGGGLGSLTLLVLAALAGLPRRPARVAKSG
jgi:extracellular elastinolytic metalloproteinase